MSESYITLETLVPIEEEASIGLSENFSGNIDISIDIVDDEQPENFDIAKDENKTEEFDSPKHHKNGENLETNNSKGPYIVNLCGLPYSAGVDDIMEFMEGCDILGGHKGVHIANGPDGRPNGIAFVELVSERDVDLARDKHKNNMGKRYIEVRHVNEGDMERMLNKWKPRRDPVNAVILIKGLPFSCTADDVREFFRGLEIESNGIMILLDDRGRISGDGFVHFTSMRSADLALQRHKEKIKHRYIEVYRSDLREMYPKVTNQLSPAGPWTNRRRDDDYYSYRSRTDERYGPIRSRGRYDDNDRRRYGGPYNRYPPHRNYRSDIRSYSPHRHYNERPRAPHKEYVPPYRSKTGYSVHMRGLPYGVTKEQILEFFSPVVPVEIVIETTRDGKRTGNANIDFGNEEDVDEAMRKDRERIDSRYIELYNSINRN